MEKIFVTADNHFSHKNILTFCSRPFKDVNEMNEAMIQNWNNVVDYSDTVYVLGDFSLGNPHSIIERLNGNIVFLKGDHDKWIDKYKWDERVSYAGYVKILYYKDVSITLCHWPFREWYKRHYGAYDLHGHSHGTLTPLKNQLDVGVDCFNFEPVSLDKIKKILS